MLNLRLVSGILSILLLLQGPMAIAKTRESTALPVTNIGGYLQLHMVSNEVGWTIEFTPIGYSRVLRTMDGGKTWSNSSPYPTMLPIKASDFMSAQRAWIVVSIGKNSGNLSSRSPVKVFATNDGGALWTRAYIAGTSMMLNTPISIDFVNPKDGWLLLGSRGRFSFSLYMTKDGGKHWTRILSDKAGTIPSTYEKIGMTFLSKTKGFISGLGSTTALYETVDGGRRWKRDVLPIQSNMTFDFVRPPVFFNHKDGMMEVQYLPDYNGKIAETEYLATQNSGRT